MPIIRSGYRSDEEKVALSRFYSSARWKRLRSFVLRRDLGRCRFCGFAPQPGERQLDCVHLGKTPEMLQAGEALDAGRCVSACRRCHSGYSSGRLTDADLLPIGGVRAA